MMIRLILYLLGLALLAVAAWVILMSEAVQRVIPSEIVAGILLIIVALGVMGLAYSGLLDERTVVRETERDETGARVHHRRVVED